jgi:hypothetical protein
MNYADLDSGVTTVWTDNGGATVTADFGAQNCVRANPAVSLSPSESHWVQPGTSVTYTVTLTNRDNDACGTSQFCSTWRTSCPAGWNVFLPDPMLILEPGQNASTAFAVTSAVAVADGFYAVAVTVTNNGASNYSAASSVTYVVSAGTGNQAPVAMDDSAVTVEGTAVTIAVLANDLDPNGDPLTVISTTQGAHGQVSLNSVGTVRYCA